jgi:hypothetical protein
VKRSVLFDVSGVEILLLVGRFTGSGKLVLLTLRRFAGIRGKCGDVEQPDDAVISSRSRDHARDANSVLSMDSFSSIDSLGQSPFPQAGNPFAYVGRAISKFDSVGFSNGKHSDCFKTHHRNLREI